MPSVALRTWQTTRAASLVEIESAQSVGGSGTRVRVPDSENKKQRRGRYWKTTMTLTDTRTFFPGTQGRVFLDAACIGLAPVQAIQALNNLGQQMLLAPERDASSHHIALDRTAGPRAARSPN